LTSRWTSPAAWIAATPATTWRNRARRWPTDGGSTEQAVERGTVHERGQQDGLAGDLDHREHRQDVRVIDLPLEAGLPGEPGAGGGGRQQHPLRGAALAREGVDDRVDLRHPAGADVADHLVPSVPPARHGCRGFAARRPTIPSSSAARSSQSCAGREVA
jgi:hypothetical protein